MWLSLCADEMMVHKDAGSMTVWNSATVVLATEAGTPEGDDAYWVIVDPGLDLTVFALGVTIHGPLIVSRTDGAGPGRTSRWPGARGEDRHAVHHTRAECGGSAGIACVGGVAYQPSRGRSPLRRSQSHQGHTAGYLRKWSQAVNAKPRKLGIDGGDGGRVYISRTRSPAIHPLIHHAIREENPYGHWRIHRLSVDLSGSAK
jgi:hypothetical protein